MSDNKLPAAVSELIDYLKLLPGIGQMTAERLAMKIICWDAETLAEFGSLIERLPQLVGSCCQCGNLADASALCFCCSDTSRDSSVICVVENALEIRSIERGGHYRGLYHVLGGKLSPLDGTGPEDLAINQLLDRLRNGQVTELIFALSADIEGQATASYIQEKTAGLPLSVSSLAQGIPAGADISYASGATLAAAFKGRTRLT